MRIVKEIEIEGKHVKALFDTGSLHTYVIRAFLEGVPIRLLSEPYRVALGGRVIEVREYCAVEGKIEGYVFDTKVVPIDNLGRVDGREMDALIGVLTMEEWEISVNPKDGTLDLSGLKRREFTEFEEVDEQPTPYVDHGRPDAAPNTGARRDEAVRPVQTGGLGADVPALLRTVYAG